MMKKLKPSYIVVFLWYLTLAVCVGGVLLAIFLLNWGNSYVICFGTPFPSYNDVERSAYLRFPPSAQNIEFDANGVSRKAGCTIWVKFEMQNEELDIFEATTQLEQVSLATQLDGSGFNFFGESKGWVQPSRSLAGHAGFNISEDQWVVIDTSQPDIWTVYLIVNKEWL